MVNYPAGSSINDRHFDGPAVCGRCGHEQSEHMAEAFDDKDITVLVEAECQVCYCETYVDAQEWLEAQREHYLYPDA